MLYSSSKRKTVRWKPKSVRFLDNGIEESYHWQTIPVFCFYPGRKGKEE
jgi:hypothetical protein